MFSNVKRIKWYTTSCGEPYTRFPSINETFPGNWSRLLKAHTHLRVLFVFITEVRWYAHHERLLWQAVITPWVWFPGIQQESLFFLWHLSKVKRACLLWVCHVFPEICQPATTLSHPSERPAASHRTALLVCSSSHPEPGWMTFRRPPPLRPASVVQQPVSPKWSFVCLARLCWTETRWISQTPVSYSWYRPTDSGQRWAPPPFFCTNICMVGPYGRKM